MSPGTLSQAPRTSGPSTRAKNNPFLDTAGPPETVTCDVEIDVYTYTMYIFVYIWMYIYTFESGNWQ